MTEYKINHGTIYMKKTFTYDLDLGEEKHELINESDLSEKSIWDIDCDDLWWRAHNKYVVGLETLNVAKICRMGRIHFHNKTREDIVAANPSYRFIPYDSIKPEDVFGYITNVGNYGIFMVDVINETEINILWRTYIPIESD